MFRRVLVVTTTVILGILAAPSATADTRSGTDLAVGLDAVGSLLFSGAHYTVSVTNNGPQPLTSATVVVQLDPRGPAAVGRPPACPVNTATATMTCSFGPLAAGATRSLTTWVLFNLPQAPTEVDATATLAASNPADTNPANNSASAECHHHQDQVGFPPHPYLLVC